MKRTIVFSRVLLTVLVAGSAGLTMLPATTALADGGGFGGGLESLKKIAVPKPTNLADYVKDEAAAVRLGKALFWDMQAGGDGQQSCASCHSAAGADNRTRNTLNPHGLAIPPWRANQELTASMFPIKSSLVVGSAGVKKTTFTDLADPSQANSGFPADLGTPVPDTVFNIDGNSDVRVRQVTGRQTPSVINSVYNFRFFWDGRARETFNGATPGGATDLTARVLRVTNGEPSPVTISIDNASAASQAVGPANNDVEMSFNGRNFLKLGKKLLHPAVVPLGSQMVDGSDSSLGQMSNGLNKGLNTRYAAMVSQAFQPQWWDSSQCVDGNKAPVSCLSPNSFTVMEANFSLFWGLAIQLYESTLIANDTPFDRNELNAQELRGQRVFTNEGRCAQCHNGPELTKASVRNVLGTVPFNPTSGFFNTAVRPVAEDGGIQDVGIANRAMFKTPHLRNVELTGPYFHNGGAATLMQVVDFYNRGGDFRGKFTDSQMRPLGLLEQQKKDLVAFMLALTDKRVKNESAPFDHPSLPIHNGADLDGKDIDGEIIVPAVGAGGRLVQSLVPLQRFLGLDPFQH